ncbi:hypothetical protein TGARI_241175 [Toxoplasma gondii ARI]|uniref:Uncharacterized protein n=1 Tax=Toxoplasma gondii ARI TaxID=1074872 RepID=A0A139XM28_TOXGO|nr:hypothetical protein TGARI_241175 [Toxoplasma gondii ARI]
MRRGSCVCARPSFPFLGSHANSTSYELLSPENDVYETLCVLLLQAKRSACFLLGAWLHPWTRTAWLVSFNHDGFCRSFWQVQIPLGCLCSRVSTRYFFRRPGNCKRSQGCTVAT